MVDSYFNIAPYLNALAHNNLILTANSRLRNHLLRAYGNWQTTQNAQVWASPRAFSLSQWIEQCWSLLQRRGHPDTAVQIISNTQRQLLWETIIGQSSLAAELLQAEPLAQAADSALRNLELWQLTEADIRAAEPMLNTHSNSYCFLTWLGEFRLQLQQQGFITLEHATLIVKQAFIAAALPPEPDLILTGFDDIPPLHQQLIEAACADPHTVFQAADSTQLIRTQAQTPAQEIRAAALWSLQQLEQNPAAMIGIIVPNLGQCRAQVERIFTEVFEPLAPLPEQPRYTLPFNFSAGTPLADCPLIYAGLELLGMHRPHWELAPVCNLLLSPFFGDFERELPLRSHLTQRLRQQGKLTLTLSDLRYHTQKLSQQLGLEEADNGFFKGLIALENTRRQSYGKHSCAYWCDFFQQQLDQLGWPGSRRLDSQEHQQVLLWNKLWETFLQLDATGSQFTYSQALQQLRKLASKTPFQAKTPHSPIQILGALEGAGLQFSHCWVLGLHHRQWPPVPAPNPLLPGQLQRDHKMPHASSERELEFARALTQHYKHCATQVILSSAQSDDASELSPSALIRNIPLSDLNELIGTQETCSEHNYLRLTQSQQLEIVDCAKAPALDPSRETVRGGASLFKEQAACPFHAFARLRLGATSLDEPGIGFSAIERGNLIHEALASIWRQLQDQTQLLALDATAQQALITAAAQTALNRVKQIRGSSIGNYYAQLEEERLIRLLDEWLNLEKERPDFKVLAIEEQQPVKFAGLPLKLRLDRIDQLNNQLNNPQLLIDYKTGQPNTRAWLGERMDEPQLPLYAVISPNPISAIAFAQINAKGMEWKGMGDEQFQHPGISAAPQEWSLQLHEWQQQLEQLAQDFLAGDARVQMKNALVAQYAEELLPLNRLLETTAIHQFISNKGSGNPTIGSPEASNEGANNVPE